MNRRWALVSTLAAASLVVAWRGASSGTPPQDPELMRVQREVWEVYFAGDTARLRQLTPGLVTISSSGEGFGDQEETIRSSAQFHARGGRLLELGFPALRVQPFGDVVIMYSTYRTVTLMGNDTTRRRGRATEVFVKQGGHWVNPGWHLDSGGS